MGEQLLVAGAILLANSCEILDVLSKLLHDNIFSGKRLRESSIHRNDTK